ncbi:MAG: META domain-containing protein [Bacteroidota bacterium]
MKNLIPFFMAAVIIISFSFHSCGKIHDPVSDEELGGFWTFDSLYDQNDLFFRCFPDSLETSVFINFSDSGCISLHGICNTGSARYYLSKTGILIYDVSLTEMYCGAGGAEWEDYLYRLNNVTSCKIEDQRLVLSEPGNFSMFFSRPNL